MRVIVVQCRGTPLEIGRKQAELFAATQSGKSFLRRKDFRRPEWLDLRTEERFYAKFSPALWQEIAGLADGLNISLERACFVFGNGSIPPRLGGCSAVMTRDVFSRNYDFHPRNYGARLALVQPEGSYASIGFSERLTGRLDGMNERGLSVALHLVGARPLQWGMSCILMIRLVLDQCATTDEAVELFRRMPHAMRYNYSLLDAGGHAAVVEAAPAAFAVRRGEWLACTNHFQSYAMKLYNRAHKSSWTRLPPLETWADRNLLAGSMFEAFNASTSPAFFSNYDRGRSGTLHTLVSEPKRRRIQVGIGGDSKQFESAFVDVDFAAWARGIDLPLIEMKGQLGGLSKPFEWPIKRRRNGL